MLPDIGAAPRPRTLLHWEKSGRDYFFLFPWSRIAFENGVYWERSPELFGWSCCTGGRSSGWISHSQPSDGKLTFGVFKSFSRDTGVRQQVIPPVGWRGFMLFHRGECLLRLHVAPCSSRQPAGKQNSPQRSMKYYISPGRWLPAVWYDSNVKQWQREISRETSVFVLFTLFWMKNRTWRGSLCDVCVSMGALVCCFCHYTIKEVLALARASSDVKDMTYSS